MTKSKKYNLAGLLKVGNLQHIAQLQKEGLLYANTIKHYRELEAKEKYPLRKDSREGAVQSIKLKSLELFVDGKKLPLTISKARLNTFEEGLDKTFIYCMYMFNIDDATGEPFIDKSNMKFGDYALFITNPPEFIKRINVAINDEYQLGYGKVNYYSDDQDYQKLTPFHKRETFSYQKEFRFHFNTNQKAPLKINIGSIEDISVAMPAKNLSKITLMKDEDGKPLSR